MTLQPEIRHIEDDYESSNSNYADTLNFRKYTANGRLFLAVFISLLSVVVLVSVAAGDLLDAPRIPAILKEVGPPARIKAAVGRGLADEGRFFGWKPSHVTRKATDFTKDELLNRWLDEKSA